MKSTYNQLLKSLERKHGRSFPTLTQARNFDIDNPSLEKLKEQNANKVDPPPIKK